MRNINLNDMKSSDKSEDEIQSVERDVEAKTTTETNDERTPLQKLTTIMFMVICAIIVVFALRCFSHFRNMDKYEVPDDALVLETEEDVSDEVPEEEINYVDEVVYNPSDAGTLLATMQNNYSPVDGSTDLGGESLWYSGSSELSYSWTFMSGYDYKSANIDCVWLCQDDSNGTIYAYHTAKYDGTTDSFTNGMTYLTKEGGSSLAAN